MKPLSGIRIIDFTTLLPGPLASLMLCEAGADVVKIEKPGGEDMRKVEPFIHNESILFAVLNRGKKSIEVNLKDRKSLEKVKKLIKTSDVIIEQFRPGVMDKLGLSWKVIKKLNKKIVYCSITGYGQHGKKNQKAGHDLNYLAESGLLKLSTATGGSPILPITQLADIAGGSYPAFMNIILALFKAKQQKIGSYIDVSMYENLIPLAWLGLSNLVTENYSKKKLLHLNGSLARYNIYQTKDKKYIALGALENKFWKKFCSLIEAPKEVALEKISQSSILKAIQKIIKERNLSYWKKKFDEENDVCCTAVNDLNEFMEDNHIKDKQIFNKKIMIKNKKFLAIPTALDRKLINMKKINKAPTLGQHNNLIK